MYDGFFITRPTFLQWSNNNINVCQGGGFSTYLEVNTNLLFPLTLTWELPVGFTANGISQITQMGDYYFYFDAPSGVVPGEYALTLNMTAQNGQVYSKKLNVIVQNDTAPVAISLISPAQNANLEGNPIAFEWSASASANYYVWTLATDPNFLQNVQTQNTTNTSLSLNAMDSGQHFWKVEAVNDCGSSHIEVGQFDLLSTGVENFTLEKFQIYPNPTQSIIYISKGLKAFQIMDVTGRVVQKHNGDYVQEINLNQLSDGMYWLRSNGMVKSFEVRH
jgi:hypothetical protein